MIDVIFLVLTIAFVIVATLAALATNEHLAVGQSDGQQAGQLQRGRLPGISSTDRLVLLLAAGIELLSRSAPGPQSSRTRES